MDNGGLLVFNSDHLLTPVSMLADGNECATGRYPVGTFPGGGILAGLHTTVFSMQATPPARTPQTTPITGPSPIDVLARRNRRR